MRNISPSIGALRHSIRRRDGYTLLELLIASVLIATLMAAVWGLMSMYASFLTAGRSQAAEQQLFRSLMELVATDLRATTPKWIAPTAQAADAFGHENASSGASSVIQSFTQRLPIEADTSETGGLAPSDQASFAAGAPPLPEITFRGDEHSLTMIGVRLEPHFESPTTRTVGESGLPQDDGIDSSIGGFAEAEGEGQLLKRASSPHWTQVIYRFVPPHAERRDDRELASGLHRFEFPIEYLGLLPQQDELLDDPAVGFGESAVDRPGDSSIELDVAVELLRAQGITEVTHEHIPEVVACRFDFLSDSTWRPQWAATPLRDRPVAVRIKLGLLSSSEHRKLMSLLGSESADEALAGDAAQVESSADHGNAADPFTVFHPRRYDRMILMELGREVRGSLDVETPDAFRPVASSRSPAGGGR